MLEQDNKNNIDNYQYYVNLESTFVGTYVEKQLWNYVQQLLKNQTEIQATIVTYSDSKNSFNNDLDDIHPLHPKKLDPSQLYQTVVQITDKNGYNEYVPIKFQVKDINLLIEKIKQVDFGQLISEQNQVSWLSFKVEKHIRQTFKETEKMQITVTVLDEEKTNELGDKEYIFNTEIQQINFQVKWKVNFFNDFDNDVNKIEQNLVLPSNFYAKINRQSELTYKIDQDLKSHYDNDKFSVYITSKLLEDGNNEKEYNKYRAGLSYNVRMAEFDSRNILAPVKYIIKVKVYSKNMSWLFKTIEKTISITEK